MSTGTHRATFTTPTPTDVVAVRTFDAPRELVFAAHTEPHHVQRWLLGPDGWSMPVCEIDLRVGGAWRYVWRNDDTGAEFGMSGVYREVDAPARAVFTEVFEDHPESVNFMDLVEAEGKTTMTLTMRYASEEIRDIVLATGMTDGMEAGYDRLDGMLPSFA
jgi:uncharacterized protein YndB with AHSA1/START domain